LSRFACSDWFCQYRTLYPATESLTFLTIFADYLISTILRDRADLQVQGHTEKQRQTLSCPHHSPLHYQHSDLSPSTRHHPFQNNRIRGDHLLVSSAMVGGHTSLTPVRFGRYSEQISEFCIGERWKSAWSSCSEIEAAYNYYSSRLRFYPAFDPRDRSW